MEPPVQATARLRLRAVVPGDLDVLYELWTDPNVRRWLWDDVAITRDVARAAIDASVASFRTDGFGLFLVNHAAADGVVGFCGLRRDGGDLELLYALAPAMWGFGYATEAAAAVLRDAFGRVRVPRVVARTDVPNAASIRVLERLGMRRVGHEPGPHGPLLAFEIAAGEFRGARARVTAG
jgi:RimJ/RimL family protein N-acetyltransferase